MIKKNLHLTDNISFRYINKNFTKSLSKKFSKVNNQIQNEVTNDSKTLNILSKNFKLNFKLNELKKFKKFKTIALIGMGGSILGSEAIYNFLIKKIKKKVYFFNNLDETEIMNFKKKENKNKVLFFIISKSGNTVETISNLYSLGVVTKNSKNIIVITEKKNSILFSLIKKFNLFYIEHKKNIGGRYSVLSEVGIVPAYLMGINILKLRSNIRNFLTKKNFLILKKIVLKLSSLINSKKITNLIFLNYASELDKFLYWCQQLIAESLGKKNKGFFPVISSVPKDHHSLLQLYLDGPRDKLFYIFSIEKKTTGIKNLQGINLKNNFLNKKKINDVKKAQIKSLIKSFKEKKIPFREFKIKSNEDEVLGSLFSYFILETIFIGRLLNLNPFDQPAVEQVKIYTKKYLHKSTK